jgi:hypothetical protein
VIAPPVNVSPVVPPEAFTDVTVPVLDVRQVPFTWTQPAPITSPFANVDDATPDVTLSAVVCTPAPKVEVAVPEIVVLAVVPIVSEEPVRVFEKKEEEVALVVVRPPLNAISVVVALLGNKYAKLE